MKVAKNYVLEQFEFISLTQKEKFVELVKGE